MPDLFGCTNIKKTNVAASGLRVRFTDQFGTSLLLTVLLNKLSMVYQIMQQK